MKSIVDIDSIRARDVGRPLIERLTAILPCPYAEAVYCATVAEDDPRWPLLRTELENAGMHPCDAVLGRDDSKEYYLAFRLAYEREDMGGFSLVRLEPLHDLLVEERIDNWQPVLVEFNSDILSGLDFGCCEYQHLASDRVRAAWEPLKPVGLEFKPVRLWHKDAMDQWDRVGGPWWLMEVPLRLPAPLPALPEQERYFNADHRYLASAIAGLGAFDVALAPYRNCPGSYFPVISKRLFDVCIANDLKGADWFPVRVEEG